MGFPGGSDGKASVYNVGDLGSIPGLGRSTGEGNGNSLQYSGLENSMDCISMGLQRVMTLTFRDFNRIKSRKRLEGFSILFYIPLCSF